MTDKNKYRDKFPDKNPDGTNIIDLESHKFIKIWQGPQHPGITGNMSLELILQGDEVMKCTTHVGYLHRGFEKLMERRKFIQCFPLVCRIAVPEPDFNEYCFAATVEELGGIEIPETAKWMRTLILEMSRLTSFLMWIGGQSGAFGLVQLCKLSVFKYLKYYWMFGLKFVKNFSICRISCLCLLYYRKSQLVKRDISKLLRRVYIELFICKIIDYLFKYLNLST